MGERRKGGRRGNNSVGWKQEIVITTTTVNLQRTRKSPDTCLSEFHPRDVLYRMKTAGKAPGLIWGGEESSSSERKGKKRGWPRGGEQGVGRNFHMDGEKNDICKIYKGRPEQAAIHSK